MVKGPAIQGAHRKGRARGRRSRSEHPRTREEPQLSSAIYFHAADDRSRRAPHHGWSPLHIGPRAASCATEGEPTRRDVDRAVRVLFRLPRCWHATLWPRGRCIFITFVPWRQIGQTYRFPFGTMAARRTQHLRLSKNSGLSCSRRSHARANTARQDPDSIYNLGRGPTDEPVRSIARANGASYCTEGNGAPPATVAERRPIPCGHGRTHRGGQPSCFVAFFNEAFPRVRASRRPVSLVSESRGVYVPLFANAARRSHLVKGKLINFKGFDRRLPRVPQAASHRLVREPGQRRVFQVSKRAARRTGTSNSSTGTAR